MIFTGIPSTVCLTSLNKEASTMERTAISQAACVSIFREGEAPLTVERYTQLWIRLINQIEQSRAAAAGIR